MSFYDNFERKFCYYHKKIFVSNLMQFESHIVHLFFLQKEVLRNESVNNTYIINLINTEYRQFKKNKYLYLVKNEILLVKTQFISKSCLKQNFNY